MFNEYIFMKMKLEKGGEVSGQSESANYVDQIEVLSFDWGLKTSNGWSRKTGADGTVDRAFTTVENDTFGFTKLQCPASIKLYNAIKSADKVVECVVTVVSRAAGKAATGGSAVGKFVPPAVQFTLKEGYLRKVQIGVEESADGAITINEKFELEFEQLFFLYNHRAREGANIEPVSYSVDFSSKKDQQEESFTGESSTP
jgi:type VI protein secretion system component Hcp